MKASLPDRARTALTIALVIVLCFACIPFSVMPDTKKAEAVTLQRGDVTRAATGGIVLDADLHTKQPYFDKAMSVASAPSATSIDTVFTYSYSLAVPAKTYRTLDTTVNVRWDDVGFDADDDRIDLVLSWLPDSRWYATSSISQVPLLQRYSENGFNSAGICIGINRETAGTKACCEQHLRISFYKHGTSTPANGSFLMMVTDLDKRGWDEGYGDRWCESIELLSGHSENVYVPDGNILNIGANRNGEAATDYRATRDMDGSSLDSGLVVQLSFGAEFWYYSTYGLTDILDQFDVQNISLFAGAGGKVHCRGKEGNIAVGWRGSRNISIEPAKGYRIADVKVDGTSIGTPSSYAFSEVTSGHTLEASFSPITYSIRFDPNGAEGLMPDLHLSYHETKHLLGNTFVRTGYRFTGWNSQPDGSGTHFADTQEVCDLSDIDGSVVDLHAQWEPIDYRVAFDANGGSGAMSEQRLPYDQTQALFANTFMRTGYIFTGWATNADGTGDTFADAQAVKNLASTEDALVKLYARWKPISYRITFDANGGNGEMSDQVIPYDHRTSLSVNQFARKGYLFTGWNTTENGTGTSYHNLQEVENLSSSDGDTITLHAQWEPIDYFISFDAQGGTGTMPDQLFTFDRADALQPNTLRRTGHRWVRWDTHPCVPEVGFEDEQIVKNLAERANETVMLYAIWAANRCLIVFESNGGSGSMRAQSLAYGTAEPLHPNEFFRDGYEWTSWNTEPDGSGVSYADEQSVQDLSAIDNGTVTLYAQWEPLSHDDRPTPEDPSDPSGEIPDTNGGNEPDEDLAAPDEPSGSDEPDPTDDPPDDDAPDRNTDDGPARDDEQTTHAQDDPEIDQEQNTLRSDATKQAPFARTGESIASIAVLAIAAATLGITMLIASARRRKRALEEKRRFFREHLKP